MQPILDVGCRLLDPIRKSNLHLINVLPVNPFATHLWRMLLMATSTDTPTPLRGWWGIRYSFAYRASCLESEFDRLA